MSSTRKHTLRTVRQYSKPRIPWFFCILLFTLTAVCVFRVGQQYFPPAPVLPTFSATAYVVQPAADNKTGLRIPFNCEAAELQQAEEAANALADSYVDDRLAEWNRRVEKQHRKVRDAVENARRTLADAENRLHTPQRQRTEATVETPPQNQPPSPTTVENIQSVELKRRLAVLERRRDALLVERTPQHPAVREITEQIEQLEREISAVASQPQAQIAISATPPELGPSLEKPALPQNEKATELAAVVEQSRLSLEQAEAAEKLALQKTRGEPRYSIIRAKAVELPGVQETSYRQLIIASLLAGLFMSVGFGSVSAGIGIESLAISVAQVQAAARTAVVGVIPNIEAGFDPRKIDIRRSQLRLTLLAFGAILMAASPFAAIWGL